jgi:hypothetical protein
MKQELTRLALLIAAALAAVLAFAGGLTLMNVRADWALVVGGLVCVAAPVLGVVFVTRILTEGRNR